MKKQTASFISMMAGMGILDNAVENALKLDKNKKDQVSKVIDIIEKHEKAGNIEKVKYWTERLERLGYARSN